MKKERAVILRKLQGKGKVRLVNVYWTGKTFLKECSQFTAREIAFACEHLALI